MPTYDRQMIKNLLGQKYFTFMAKSSRQIMQALLHYLDFKQKDSFNVPPGQSTMTALNESLMEDVCFEENRALCCDILNKPYLRQIVSSETLFFLVANHIDLYDEISQKRDLYNKLSGYLALNPIDKRFLDNKYHQYHYERFHNHLGDMNTSLQRAGLTNNAAAAA